MESEEFNDIFSCLVCGESNLKQYLNLGRQPLANSYAHAPYERPQFPLGLNVCKSCFHSQLTICVKPELMFMQYSYISGVSKTMIRYFESISEQLIQHRFPVALEDGDVVLDVGSNDGSFLATLWAANPTINAIGVDPASNLCALALNKGVITLNGFLDSKVAYLLKAKCKVVTAFNVFAHSFDPYEMLKNISDLLCEDGMAIVLTSQANMFSRFEFDTVYHEHINFFNCLSMETLAKRTNLHLVDVRIEDIHGDSYLWIFTKKPLGHSNEFEQRKALERRMGLYDLDSYENYYPEIDNRLHVLKEKLEEYRSQGFTITVFGSPAKGITFLNHLDESIDALFDDTPQKVSTYSPYKNTLVQEGSLFSTLIGKVCVLILAWNFKDEIRQRILELRNSNLTNLSIISFYPELEIEDFID